jgi:outer membrane lipopolysaccharide assembly protein LptE/RlpB
MILKNKILKHFKTSCCILAILFIAGCGVYGFSDKGAIPADIRTVRIGAVEKNSPLDNIQLRQRVGDRLRQKIVGQTRLSQTNSDSADWDINVSLTQYSPSTSAISNQQAVTNRLTVVMHVSRNQRKNDEVKEYEVSRSFEFSANLSLQAAETSLLDEMTRTLTDEIFNKLFSDW